MTRPLRIMVIRWGMVAVAAAILVGMFSYSYGEAVRAAAINDAQAEAERRATLEVGTLVSDIEKFRVLPFVLVELPGVREALSEGSADARHRLDERLRALAARTGATVLYAVDRNGIARSASNASQPDSFVGHDFRFRPYVVDALARESSEYFAEGAVTGRSGLFLARRAGSAAAPDGVIIVKIEFSALERLWRAADRLSFVVDRDGVVIVTTEPTLRSRTITPLSPARLAEIRRTRQFGDATIADAGLRFLPGGLAQDAAGRRYIAIARTIPGLDWRHIHLEPLRPVIDATRSRVRLATLLAALTATVLIALLFWATTRRQRLAAAHAELEAEVGRRTTELRDAYARLQHESSERESADSRYRTAREELAQANRLGSIGTITTSVAHELNQPVAAIRTAAENASKLLARGQQDKAEKNLSLIVSLTQRIGSITGELLSYGRRGRPERAVVPLDEILDGALMLIGDSFRRARVKLEVERAPGLPSISASRIRIEQVLVNLLQNALDAVQAQPGALVRIEASASADTAQIVIHDNGPGISAELGDTVFQPFVTGKPGGTGLGLGISREIVQDHGGTLTVASSPFGGAAFRVSLPLSQGALR